MFKLAIVIAAFHCANAQQISKLKSNETSLITESQSQYPYLMEFGSITKYGFSKYIEGTLISADFVLTATTLVSPRTVVRKLVLPGETFSNTQHFTIKRVIMNESFKKRPPFTTYIGLVQLNEAVPYHSTTSIYRPALLWTDTIEPSTTYQLSIRLIQADSNGTEQFATFSARECAITDSQNEIYVNSEPQYMCFNLTQVYKITYGSPLMFKLKDQNYIFGFYTGAASFLGLGLKVDNYIDWIKSIVWPNNNDLQCGQRKIQHTPYMLHAEPTYHGEFPWHVALFRNLKYICGGTIISNRIVLTAAHCVHDGRGIVPANRITIIAGTHNINEMPIEAQNYVVKQIIVHENYSRANKENDIAVLKLRDQIEFSSYIQPICIGKDLNYANFTMGTVAGWGKNEHDQQPTVLLQATFPILSISACRATNRIIVPIFLNEFNYCAGIQNGTNVGTGDSGGSMIVEYKSQWYIRGIVSLGIAVPSTGQVDPLQMAFFTNVPLFFDWIDNHSKNDE